MPGTLLLALLLPQGLESSAVSLDGTWEIAPVDPNAPDRLSFRPVEVPAAFETALGTSFDGIARYRRVLPVAASMRGASVLAEFEAVATHASIRCNGEEVCEHLGGWTPFCADLTPHLRFDGADRIEIDVDERVGHNTQGFLPVVQPHFGGLWQGARLRVVPRAAIDRHRLFAFGHGDGRLELRVPILGPSAGSCSVLAELRDEGRVLAREEIPFDGQEVAHAELRIEHPRLWAPWSPHLYGLVLVLRDGEGRPLDRVERRTGFRDLSADGTRIAWNGIPFQLRGVLHWGYSAPALAPPPDESFWRKQLLDFKSLGFNALKCCLFVPPSCVYDLCDELGLVVWQEYPTWHPRMDQRHRDELLREYREFFAHDGPHPSVAIRSLTCETGQGADLDVLRALYRACHEAVPDTLVVDDSSWIGWQRISDFYDEHPYGNNRWWPRRLEEFRTYLSEHEPKPLLLGECIAADTWVDSSQWPREAQPYYAPTCLASQREVERWIASEFGRATLDSLLPLSRDYGLASRRFQIERLRTAIPEAGYIVSVARDIPRCRMGLYDDFGRLKWSASDWSFQRDASLSLSTPDDGRALVGRGKVLVAAALAGPAASVREGTIEASWVDASGKAREFARPVATRPYSPSQALEIPIEAAAGGPDRIAIRASFTPRGAREPLQSQRWTIWRLPPFDEAAPRGVRIANHLDADLLSDLEQGARVLLRVDGARRGLKSVSKWYLSGAPFAPEHPVHRALPPELLIDLQPFDLDGGRMVPFDALRGQVDPILAFWETHDLDEVRLHLFAFDCRVGRGRLLASAFDHETSAGRYVEHALLQHLAHGPAPRRALSAGTLASLRESLAEQRIEIPVWRFATDPDDVGVREGWYRPNRDLSVWRQMRAGSHWENQAEDLRTYDGVAWYRAEVEVPAAAAGRSWRAVFEGVDDSYTLWVDGRKVAAHGDPQNGVTVWLDRQVDELAGLLPLGRHSIALRVVDHGGAGGLWKPVFLTTGPPEGSSPLLQ